VRMLKVYAVITWWITEGLNEKL